MALQIAFWIFSPWLRSMQAMSFGRQAYLVSFGVALSVALFQLRPSQWLRRSGRVAIYQKSATSPALERDSAEENDPPLKSRLRERTETVRDPASEAIERSLDHIRIPTIEFEGTSLEEAVDFLRLKEIKSDELEARDFTLRQTLDEIARQTDCRIEVRQGTICFIARK